MIRVTTWMVPIHLLILLPIITFFFRIRIESRMTVVVSLCLRGQHPSGLPLSRAPHPALHSHIPYYC